MSFPCQPGTIQTDSQGLKGQTKILKDNLEIYYSLPSFVDDKPTRAVIFWHDVFGFQIPNCKRNCDWFAEQGYVSVVGDFYRGNPWTADRDRSEIQKWKDSIPQERVHQDFLNIVEFISQQFPSINKISGIGYCWGGKQVALAARSGKLSSAASVHGILFEEDDILQSQCPIAFLIPENDQHAPEDKRKMLRDVFIANPQKSGFVKEYLGCGHGFGNRGNYENEVERKARDELRNDIHGFFLKY